MPTCEELLEQAAQDGTWISEDWSEALEGIIVKLDATVRSAFPIPILPPESPTVQLGSPLREHDPSSQESQTSNKENTPTHLSASRPPVPAFTTQTQEHDDNPQGFPPDLAILHRSIKKSLQSGFPRYPPHTVQRLAELILYPQRHYRFLPPYLHALDRVISVSSTTAVFPLPQAGLPPSSGVLNGIAALPRGTVTAELGSDESLGGALLTPIPWLGDRDSQRSSGSSAAERELQTSSTEMVEGPNGAGRIETVNVVNGVMSPVSTHQALGLGAAGPLPSQSHTNTIEESLRAEGAVTQGELLRQEQEAGVVPVQPRGLRMSDQELDVIGTPRTADSKDEEDKPHARGPEEIGMEDTGPQAKPAGSALDLEAAVGRSRGDGSADRELDPEDASLSDAGGGENRDEEMKDADEPETVDEQAVKIE